MQFKPLIYNIDFQGQTYRFAALKMKDVEYLAEQEAACPENDPLARHKVHAELLAESMRRAGEVVTAEELLEHMPLPVFTSLFFALMKANGMKLEGDAKLGEKAPS